MTSSVSFTFPVVVADIGGTNARFACLKTPTSALSDIVTVPTNFSTKGADTIREAVRLGGWPNPKSLVLAVAGVIEGHGAELNNSRTADGRLRMDGPVLMPELGLVDGLIINDFEALSMALPELEDDDCILLRDRPKRSGHKLVVGGGTGLGVGLLLDTPQGWLPVASQGGHLRIAINDEPTRAILKASGIIDWTGDEILSGRGLLGLYRGCCSVVGVSAKADRPEGVGALYASGDAQARQAVDIFADQLSQFAASLTLITLPDGGVFIGGGLAPRFADAFTIELIDHAFQPGGDGAIVLAGSRVSLITLANPAFRGLAALARRPQAFAIDHRVRRWREAT